MEYGHNHAEYSVSEIAGRVKRLVEEHFGYVRVRGEISKVTINAASGHGYLTLKDERAVLDAVCWKGTLARLAHAPAAGMEVIATGKLTTYPGQSKYQLVIESLEPAGIGALMAMLEARRKQLAAEGLFDAARKRPLPFLPDVVGVITSPTGAVIRDILHRLGERFPRHVLLWPVPVQGSGAAEKIAAAIAGFNALPGTSALPRPQVLIVARGGGSIEDLWAFNEEIVVRAAAASAIPLISAVGHETDTTLIDFAADRRAPTPSAAAEMAVPVRLELLAMLHQREGALMLAMQGRLARAQERVEGLARGLPRPEQLVAAMAQALDQLSERLGLALPQRLAHAGERLSGMAALLAQQYPQQLRIIEQRLGRVTDRLSLRLLRERLQREQTRLQHVAAMLDALDVLAVLRRGFALVRGEAGQIIPSAAAMPASGTIALQFHDATRQVALAQAGASAPRSRRQSSSQHSLFPAEES